MGPTHSVRVELRPLDRRLLERRLDELIALDAVVRAELGDAYSHESWGRREFLAERSGKWRYSMAAFVGERLAGFVIASREAAAVHLHRLAVAPALRNRGIAGMLVGAVEAAARRDGLVRLGLSVGSDNAPALAFWERHGFRPLDADGHRAYAAARGLKAVGSAVVAGGRPYRILEKRMEEG